MKFSERQGLQEVKSKIQFDYIDNELKNSLWNVFDVVYNTEIKQGTSNNDRLVNSNTITLIKRIWFSYFKEPLDDIPVFSRNIRKEIRNRFFDFKWYEIYDFLEYIIQNPGPIDNEEFISNLDQILKRELSGYRIVNNEFIPITDENQISQIQQAIDNTDNSNLKGIHIHLETALKKLSDKKTPDYRNSIKESISAVESICQIISGDPKAELGKALKIIKDKIGMHLALQQGFTKIYGYTSDGDGIRHSLTEESNLDLEDAIYMLTSCSAFVNYLMVKATKSGIVLN